MELDYGRCVMHKIKDSSPPITPFHFLINVRDLSFDVVIYQSQKGISPIKQ